MSETKIPERWHLEPMGERGRETRFPWRLMNNRGQFISLIGSSLADRICSLPELEEKVAEQATDLNFRDVRIIDLEDIVKEQTATIERLEQRLQSVNSAIDKGLEGDCA